MYAGIRAPAAGSFDGLPEDDGKAIIQDFLDAYGVLLNLPAMIICTVVGELDKVALFAIHKTKVIIPGLLLNMLYRKLYRLQTGNV